MAVRDTSSQDRPVQKRKLDPFQTKYVIAACIAILIFISLRSWMNNNESASSVNASRLQIATVKRGDFIHQVSVDCKVVAPESALLHTQASGSIRLLVKAGDKVAPGDILAEINNPELVNSLAQAEANLDALKNEVEAVSHTNKKKQRQAEMALEIAKVKYQGAANELERSQKAFEKGAYSGLAVSKAQDTLISSKIEYEQAQQLLQDLPLDMEFEQKRVDLALKKHELVVQELQRKVASLKIQAPSLGYIGQILIAPLSHVNADTAIMSLVNLSSLELEMEVPEGLAREIIQGMAVNVELNSATESAVVSAVSPQVIDNRVIIRGKFNNPDISGIKQGQRVPAKIVIEKKSNTLYVSRGSFVTRQGNASIYRITDNQATKTNITVGSISLEKVEILSGLAEGNRVVISGHERFENAQTVTVSQN